MRIKQWERNINVVLSWAGICWEEQNTSSPEKACVVRYKIQDNWVQDLSKQLGKQCKFKGIIHVCKHYFWDDQKEKKNTSQRKILCHVVY